MVVHLLVLGRVVSHEGTAREQQVRTCGIETLVDEEVLLLPTEVRGNLLYSGIKVMAYIGGCYVHGMEGAKQRSLIVECLTAVRDEYGGDTECIVDDEYG